MEIDKHNLLFSLIAWDDAFGKGVNMSKVGKF